jgi:hypothetical protein
VSAIAVPTTIVGCALSPPFLRRSCARLATLLPHAETVTLERRSSGPSNTNASDDEDDDHLDDSHPEHSR